MTESFSKKDQFFTTFMFQYILTSSNVDQVVRKFCEMFNKQKQI